MSDENKGKPCQERDGQPAEHAPDPDGAPP